LVTLAKFILSANRSKVRGVDVRVFTFFEICGGCNTALNPGGSLGVGTAKAATQNGKTKILFDQPHPPPGTVTTSNPNRARAETLVNSAGGEMGWFKTFTLG
jgi:hypothetical protein